jgi:hypothetical protein
MGGLGPLRYEIRVEGHLDASHAEWLGDLSFVPTSTMTMPSPV